MDDSEIPYMTQLKEIVIKEEKRKLKEDIAYRSDGMNIIKNYVKEVGGVISGNLAFGIENITNLRDYHYLVYVRNPRVCSIHLANKLLEANKENIILVETGRDMLDDSFYVKFNGIVACKMFSISEQDMNVIKGNEFVPDYMLYSWLYRGLSCFWEYEMWESYINWLWVLRNRKSRGRGKSSETKIESNQSDIDVPKKFQKFIDSCVDDKTFAYCGGRAYRFHMYGKLGSKGSIEGIITNRDVIDKLKEKFGNEIQVREQKSYLNLNPTKYVVRSGKEKLADLYDCTELCIPIAKKGICSRFVVLWIMYAGVFTSQKITGGEGLRNRLYGMIGNLEEKIFRDGPVVYLNGKNCIGEYINAGRERKIKKWNREFTDKSYYFTYKPEIWLEKNGKLLELKSVKKEQS